MGLWQDRIISVEFLLISRSASLTSLRSEPSKTYEATRRDRRWQFPPCCSTLPGQYGHHLSRRIRRRRRPKPQPDASLHLDHVSTVGWLGYSRRINQTMLSGVLGHLGGNQTATFGGPTTFVETAADGLVSAGVPPEKVRT